MGSQLKCDFCSGAISAYLII